MTTDFYNFSPPDVDLPVLPRINPGTLESYQPAKIFQDNTKRITSLHFDDSGQYLITASEDDSLQIYDCIAGNSHRTLFSKKYGCHLARFTHRGAHHVLYVSTKNSGERAGADVIRYLSSTDNRYITYFHGHKHSVTSLDVSPLDDMFVSASLDGTVRIWDTRTPNCQGCINLVQGQRALVGIDPTSKVLAIVTQFANNCELPCIRLYDARNFDGGAFATQPLHDPTFNYTLAAPPFVAFSGLKFSPDGGKLLITTTSDVHYIVDSFQPSKTICKVGAGVTSGGAAGNMNDVWVGSEADFVPDSHHVLTANASEGGTVSAYACEGGPQGTLISQLDYVAPTPVHRVAFNHKYNMFVSTSQTALCFWIPS